MRSIFVETESTTDKIESSIMANFMPEVIKDDEVALTFDGKIAIKRKTGEYVTYNVEDNIITNHLDLVVDIPKIFILFPVNNVTAGDIIKEKNTYYYVKGVTNGKLNCVNLSTGNVNNVVREQNIITGTKMFRKVKNLMDMTGTEDTTFNGNNLLPLLLMKDGDSSDLGKMFMMMNMNNANTTGFNPIMFMLMDKDKDFDISKVLMMNMMQNGQNPFAPATNNTAE